MSVSLKYIAKKIHIKLNSSYFYILYFAFLGDKTSKSDMKILLSILVIMVSTLVPNISGFHKQQYPRKKAIIDQDYNVGSAVLSHRAIPAKIHQIQDN